jgi:hypothetical protein
MLTPATAELLFQFRSGFRKFLPFLHLKILQPVMSVHLVTQFGLQGLDGISCFLHQIAHAVGSSVFRHPVTVGALTATGFLVAAEPQGLD